MTIKYFDIAPIRDFHDFYNEMARRSPDKIAVSQKENGAWREYSYGQLCESIQRFVSCFKGQIYHKHVAIIDKSSYLWIVSAIGTACAGGVFVPFDKDMPAEEIQKQLDHADIDLIILSDGCKALKYTLRTKAKIILVSEVGKILKNGNCSGAPEKFPDIEENSLAAIVYTSGTTGRTKGVMLTHRNITASITGVISVLDTHNEILSVLPIHHIYPLVACVFSYLVLGKKIYINDSLKNMFKNMKELSPDDIMLVPAMVEGFYKNFKNDMSKLKTATGGRITRFLTGGATLPKYLIAEFEKAGFIIGGGYGLTECAPIVSVNDPPNYKPGSVGVAVKNVSVDFGEDAEVYVSGDNVTLGYYKDSEATDAAIFTKDGKRWLKTGDLGYLDEDGFLFLTGRKKNLIILSSGKNISPEELEEMLKSNLPFILEVLVYDEKERIVAEIYPDANSNMSNAEIENAVFALNSTLSGYKRIRKVVIRDCEFPKSATKKILRHNAKDTT